MTPRHMAITRRIVPIAFYVLLAFFLFLYLRRVDFAALADVRIEWTSLLVASAFAIGFRFWGAFIWLVLLRGLGAGNLHGSRRQLTYVYAKSWLGRYIPGTAPWILGKIYFASQHGVSKSKLAVSSLLEGGLQIVVLMALSFLLLAFDPRMRQVGTGAVLLMLGVMVVCLVTLVPSVFNGIVSTAYRLLRKRPLEREHHASTGTIGKGVALYAVGAVISGLSLFYVIRAVHPAVGHDQALFVMGAANFAGAASMIAICAPSGLGVREGILLVLLGLIMPPEFALAATVISRLWGIVMDFAFLALARLLLATRNASA